MLSCIDLGLELPVKLHEDAGTTTLVFLGGSPRDRLWLLEVAKEEGVHSMESGLLYKVLGSTSNTGPRATPHLSSLCTVKYSGFLQDGTKFDDNNNDSPICPCVGVCSCPPPKPTSFTVSTVIEGWQQALQNMSEGDTWDIWVPSSLAYGDEGRGLLIGPGAALRFTLKLIKIK